MQAYRLLYAEDEDQLRENYTKNLRRDFKEVYSVSNGLDAYDIYLKHKPEIVLLDINMPKINGLELAKKIRKNDKTTRIIILTAHVEQDKLLFAAELNLTKYLPKATSRSDLKNALNEAVSQCKELYKQNSIVYLEDKFKWHTSKKILENDTILVKLTKFEILLLELLSSKENRIFSFYEISQFIWEDIYEEDTGTKKLKDIMKRIRKKLPANAIENVYGAGYRLNFKKYSNSKPKNKITQYILSYQYSLRSGGILI